MISLKNPNQIAKMREAGKILREVEDEVRLAIKPGVTTAELDIMAERLIRKNHAIPSSLHYEGYPCSICASINDEVVHGIPSDRRHNPGSPLPPDRRAAGNTDRPFPASLWAPLRRGASPRRQAFR